MIAYSTSVTDRDFQEIIDLQKANLKQSLTDSEILTEGFVTVTHTMEDLKKMNAYESNLVIKDGDHIVGYLLAMTKNSKADIPVLTPMFESFDNITFKNKFISAQAYIVVGQVCIGKGYRGRGLLTNAYKAFRDHYKDKYDFAITEIATLNPRSVNAHRKIGFKEIHRYTDPTNIEWSVVIWDWS